MNRLDLVHSGVRTDFPASLAGIELNQATRDHAFAPLTAFYLAVAGFVGCGAVVILAASLIALQIR